MKEFIPLSAPNLNGNELKYAMQAIETEWVSSGGAFINEFENNIATYLDIEAAVACQSGTAGLHLALHLVGVESEDEVIVPTVTFIAAVNPVSYVGANPVFMDCDNHLTMDLDKLECFLSHNCELSEEQLINKRTGKRIKALVIVHVFGNMPDMERLMKLCKLYKLHLIEDATEALGSCIKEGDYAGKYAGTIGDVGVYSFNGNKIITSGGGGMFVSNDKVIANKAKYLSTQAKDDPLYYTHNEIGYNYRMTNLQAAVGLAQLEKLDEFICIKKRNYQLYKERIEDIDGLTLLEFNSQISANYWFYSLIIDKEKLGCSRDELMIKLKKKKIMTRPLWGLIHEQKPYRGYDAYNIDNANYYYENLLNIPCSSNLKENEIMYICDVLQELSMGRK